MQKNIKHGKIGLLFWFLTCVIGSFVDVSVERYYWNQVEGHFISFPDLIFLSGILTVIALISTTPTILAIYFLSRKSNNLGLLISSILLVTFIIGFIVVLNLSKSISDTLQILSPYFLLSFLLQYFFLKIERSITPNNQKRQNDYI